MTCCIWVSSQASGSWFDLRVTHAHQIAIITGLVDHADFALIIAPRVDIIKNHEKIGFFWHTYTKAWCS